MADDKEEEQRPLLKEQLSYDSESLSSPPCYEASVTTSGSSQSVGLPRFGTDDQPPPYSPTPQGGLPMINCKVCQAMINIEHKQHQHVVKCLVCNEATPIKAPPPGKQYVRCPCNCLLVCRSEAPRISCPRPNCKRVINLAGVNLQFNSQPQARVSCAYCSEVFVFPVINKPMARCPHCRRLSSVGTSYARVRGTICLIFALIFLAAGVGVTVGTLELARSSGGIYVVWIGAFISGILLLMRAIWFFSIRTSYYISGP